MESEKVGWLAWVWGTTAAPAATDTAKGSPKESAIISGTSAHTYMYMCSIGLVDCGGSRLVDSVSTIDYTTASLKYSNFISTVSGGLRGNIYEALKFGL